MDRFNKQYNIWVIAICVCMFFLISANTYASGFMFNDNNKAALRVNSLTDKIDEKEDIERFTAGLRLFTKIEILKKALLQRNIINGLRNEQLERMIDILGSSSSNNGKARQLYALFPSGSIVFKELRQVIVEVQQLYEKLDAEPKRKAKIVIAGDIELPAVLLGKIKRIVMTDFKDLIKGVDYDFSEGRNVYIDLRKLFGTSFLIGNESVELIKLKGVCFNSDEELQPFKGVFPLKIDFGPNGEVVSQTLPVSKPTGAMTMDTVENEFSLTDFAFVNGVPIAMTIGKASFDELDYQGNQLGVLILGIKRADGKDLRTVLAELAGGWEMRDGAFMFTIDPGKTIANRYKIIALSRRIGKAYKDMHKLRIFNHMAHMGNILATLDGSVRIADLEYSKRLVNPTVPQEVAYRVNDLRAFFTGLEFGLNPAISADLRDKFGIDITKEFLASYLGEYAAEGAFHYYTQKGLNLILGTLHNNKETINQQPLLISVQALVRAEAGQSISIKEGRNVADFNDIDEKLSQVLGKYL